MRCCNTESVKNTVLGKEFWYCRECKKEVNSGFPHESLSSAMKDIYKPIGVASHNLAIDLFLEDIINRANRSN